MRRIALLTLLLLAGRCALAQTPYGRVDFSLQNAQGQAISGATVTVYAQSACGVPYSGLQTLYPTAAGGTPLGNPLTTDGFGHAFAYLPVSCFTVVYNSPYTGTLTYIDQNSVAGSAIGVGTVSGQVVNTIPLNTNGTSTAINAASALTQTGSGSTSTVTAAGTVAATTVNSSIVNGGCNVGPTSLWTGADTSLRIQSAVASGCRMVYDLEVPSTGETWSADPFNNVSYVTLMLGAQSGSATITTTAPIHQTNGSQIIAAIPRAITIQANAATNFTPQITGSVTSGTFQSGETIQQATTGAYAVVLGPVSGSGPLYTATVYPGTLAPDASDIWTGFTSGATFTPSAIPTPGGPLVTMGYNANISGTASDTSGVVIDGVNFSGNSNTTFPNGVMIYSTTIQEHSGIKNSVLSGCMVCFRVSNQPAPVVNSPQNFFFGPGMEVYPTATPRTPNPASLTGGVSAGSAVTLPVTAGTATSFFKGEPVLIDQSSFTLTAAANASGGTTVYTGTFPSGASNNFASLAVVISGFDTSANNGTFTVTASSTTSLTVSNASGVSDTHAGTAVIAAAAEEQTITAIPDANDITVANLALNHATSANVVESHIGVDLYGLANYISLANGASAGIHNFSDTTVLGKVNANGQYDNVGLRINFGRGGSVNGYHCEASHDCTLLADEAPDYGLSIAGASCNSLVTNCLNVSKNYGVTSAGITFSGARFGAAYLIADYARPNFDSASNGTSMYTTGAVATGNGQPALAAGMSSYGDIHIGIPNQLTGSNASKFLYFDATYNNGATNGNLDTWGCNNTIGSGTPPASSLMTCSHTSGVSGVFRWSWPSVIMKFTTIHSLALADAFATGYDQRAHTDSTSWLDNAGLSAVLDVLVPVSGSDALGYQGTAITLSSVGGIPTFTKTANATSCGNESSFPAGNNTRGDLTIVGGTATTGTICTVFFTAPVSAITETTAGTGYVTGDTVTFTCATTNAVGTVTASGGAVSAVAVKTEGASCLTATSVAPVSTSGIGTGLLVTLTANLSAAPSCLVTQNGGTALYDVGWGAPSASSLPITAGLTIATATLNVHYQCGP